MRTAFIFIFLSLACSSGQAHDPYSGLKSPSGQLCCGGDDCEVIVDFIVHPDGAATFYSRRHQLWVSAEADQITWISLPGGQAHWCGQPYRAGEDHTVGLLTYCAFIDPRAF